MLSFPRRLINYIILSPFQIQKKSIRSDFKSWKSAPAIWRDSRDFFFPPSPTSVLDAIDRCQPAGEADECLKNSLCEARMFLHAISVRQLKLKFNNEIHIHRDFLA